MGRTKRLRQRKRSNVTSTNITNFTAICLHNYMTQFGWINHNKLLCKDFGITGRGLCSKTGISTKDNILIKLPLKAMITIATLENDDDFRNSFMISSDKTDFQSLLAFYILYRKHVSKSESVLKLYIDSIPKAFSTPYFCKSDELYFLPEAILQQTVEQNKKIRSSFDTFQKAFDDKNCHCCGQSFMLDIITLGDFKWAYFAVNSRCVFLNAHDIKSLINGESHFKHILSDEPDMALAPFLDMFNHSDSARTDARVVNDNQDLCFQLITRDSYRPYEQIFISYGNLTNLQLLTDYGFALTENVHDFFEISLIDIETFIKTDRTLKSMHFHSNKFKFIRDHNLNDQMFIHAVDGLSHNLQVTLYLIFKEPSHFDNVLNQTAFGSNMFSADSIHDEAKLLILYKINEYQSFIDGFLRLKDLSLSAQATVQYLKQSISYLQSFLKRNF